MHVEEMSRIMSEDSKNRHRNTNSGRIWFSLKVVVVECLNPAVEKSKQANRNCNTEKNKGLQPRNYNNSDSKLSIIWVSQAEQPVGHRRSNFSWNASFYWRGAQVCQLEPINRRPCLRGHHLLNKRWIHVMSGGNLPVGRFFMHFGAIEWERHECL